MSTKFNARKLHGHRFTTGRGGGGLDLLPIPFLGKIWPHILPKQKIRKWGGGTKCFENQYGGGVGGGGYALKGVRNMTSW